jgi:hypothetical protein
VEQKELIMAPQGQHQDQAKHNQKLLEILDGIEGGEHFDDWYVTVTFYTALHCFEAVLPVVAKKINYKRKMSLIAEHYDAHIDRLIAMRMEFGEIYPSYSSLYNRSRAAKYREYKITPTMKELAKKRLGEVIGECDRTVKKWGA